MALRPFPAVPLEEHLLRAGLQASQLHKETKPARTPAVPRRRYKMQASATRKLKRLQKILLGPVPAPKQQQIHDYVYKQFSDEPEVQLSGFVLVLFSPILICIHLSVGRSFSIPIEQHLFVSSLVGFLYNLISIIRANQLMPFLPNPSYDNQLKMICVMNVVAVMLCLAVGWNGSGGMIYAIYWQFQRGNRGIFYLIIFGVIIAGSITMEKSMSLMKLLQFLPGILFGFISSTLFTLRKSSPYAIANQILFFLMVTIPFSYQFSKLIVPSFKQWAIMIGSGFTMFFTLLMLIKLMQTQRSSIVMGITSGIIIIATSTYVGVSDYVAFLTIALSILILLKMEYLDAAV